MVNRIFVFIFALLFIALTSSCGRQEQLISTAVVTVDPCAIVLMSSSEAGSGVATEVDASIERYRRAVPDAINKVPRVERLGWAFVEKARESYDSGYYTLANQAGLCIESLDPGSAESLLLRGHVLHNLHRFNEAELLARQLVEERGLWFDFALLGDVLTERGSLNEAVEAYQIVINQRPGPQAYARVARLRWLKGDLEGAIEMMTQAAGSTSTRSPEAAAWAHVQLSMLQMQNHDFDVADKALTKALSLKPQYPPALHARGRLLLAQDRPRDAVATLTQAVDADPLPEFRWTLAEALRAAGRHEAAGEQEALLHLLGAAEDRRTFALFLANTGDDSETAVHLALQELEERQDVFTLDAIAWALSAAGFHTDALDYSKRALAQGTGDARLYLHAGVIAARTGDKDGSVELLNKAYAIKHMLLPSERAQLVNQFASFTPQISAPLNIESASF